MPGVRYRRTILAPARWILAATDLPGRGAPWPEWVESLADWRHRVGVPDAVYLGANDRRIRLHSDESAHLNLARSVCTETGCAVAPDDVTSGRGAAHAAWPGTPSNAPPVTATRPLSTFRRRTGSSPSSHAVLPGTVAADLPGDVGAPPVGAGFVGVGAKPKSCRGM